MGRQVRRVPQNWQHPQRENERTGEMRDQPMLDERFEDAAKDWKNRLAAWEAGERPDYISDESRGLEFWEYEGGPPERDLYRPWRDEEATWWQLWQTVSEGTPTSPPFETAEELITYLAEHGDFWDQKRCLDPKSCGLWGFEPGKSGWGRARAEAFVKAGWAPSMMVANGVVSASKDIPLILSVNASPDR